MKVEIEIDAYSSESAASGGWDTSRTLKIATEDWSTCDLLRIELVGTVVFVRAEHLKRAVAGLCR